MNSLNNTSITLNEVDLYEFKKNGVPVMAYLVVLCIVGTIGNLNVLIVYSFRYRSSVYKTFVLCLAVVDFLACAFCIPIALHFIKHPNTVQSDGLCKFARGADYFVGACSLALLDVIAVERYRKVCQATRVQFTLRMARIFSVSVIGVVFIVAIIPVTIIYGINRKITSYRSLFGYECTVLEKFKSSVISQIYRGTLFLLFIFLFVVNVVLYSLIGRKIYKQQLTRMKSQNRKKLQKSKKQSSQEPVHHITIPHVQIEDVSAGSSGGNGEVLIESTEITCENLMVNNKQTDVVVISGNNRGVNASRKSLFDTRDSRDVDDFHSRGRGNLQKMTCSKDKNIKLVLTPDISKKRLDKNQLTSRLRRRKNKKSQIDRSKNITMVFLIVSGISFGGYLPYLILTLIRNIDRELYENFSNSNGALDSFIEWMFYLNNAVNPVVYGFMDRKFRKELCIVYNRAKMHIFSRFR